MSIIHATAASGQPLSSAFGAVIEAATPLWATIRASATRIFAAIEQRFVHRRLARFSDRMLRDLGFERDWDGAIRSLRDLD